MLACIAGPSDDSTPITRIFGLKLLAAIATPEMSPPPPIGTTMQSTSGQSCTISSPRVPWPAMTWASSNGWTYVSPSSRTSSFAFSFASSQICPWSTTSPPYAFVAAILAGVAFVAMQMTARMPWILAASATPCAWLPADEQTTPRRFSSSESCANLFSGPRILYEPTVWKHSALSRASNPVRSLSCRDVSSGVCLMWAAMRARASSKSRRVSVSIGGRERGEASGVRAAGDSCVGSSGCGSKGGGRERGAPAAPGPGLAP